MKQQGLKRKWHGTILAALLGWGLLVPSAAGAAKLYQFSGKVSGVRGDTIALSHGLETLEISRASVPKASRELRRVKVGDELTIWYRLEAQKAESYDPSRQQPGQVAPQAQPEDGVPPENGVPQEKKRIIIDDRAFYDARNERGSSPRPGA